MQHSLFFATKKSRLINRLINRTLSTLTSSLLTFDGTQGQVGEKLIGEEKAEQNQEVDLDAHRVERKRRQIGVTGGEAACNESHSIDTHQSARANK